MTHALRPVAPFAAGPALALALLLAGCRSEPPAERTVYVAREMPLVLAYEGTPQAPSSVAGGGVRGNGVAGTSASVPPGFDVTGNDPDEEARRRAWIEDTYYRPRVQVVEQQTPGDRYVPAPEMPPERPVGTECEPSRVWLPPIQLSLGYWGGDGGHHGHDDHGGWSWGVGWGFPLWGW